ncbi:MAG: adenylate/guanylate cyclase domain-containing protein [Candidatus Kuenenia sp.]|nr:adenylate/guanylate cyclase domain-containing protein [Candidatus Kuenenia hertensis]
MSFFNKKFTNFLDSFLETNNKEENKATQTPEETNSNNELLETHKNNSPAEDNQEYNQPFPKKADDTLRDNTFEETTVTVQEVQNHIFPEEKINATINPAQREISPENSEEIRSENITAHDTFDKDQITEAHAATENTADKIAEMPKAYTTVKTCGKNTQTDAIPEENQNNNITYNSPATTMIEAEKPEYFRPETRVKNTVDEKQEESHQGKKDEEKVKEKISQTIEKVKHNSPQPSDIEKLIEQREYLENLLKEKFTKRMTVMFTDLKGSTSIADAEGDIASRTIMKQHNDVLFPIIKKYDGVLVKTMGDGTLSYFEDAQKAVLAAVEAQIGFDSYNVEKKPKTLLLVSMGLHTGEGVVEENDIFGDVVNVASRIESASNPGEIYLTEDTYNALTDKSEIYIRYIKSTTLKGKKGEFRLYKAFWDEKEIELDKFGTKEEEVVAKKRFPFVKVSMAVSIPFMITYLLMLGGVVPNPFISSTASKTERRSLSADISVGEVNQSLEHPIIIVFDNEE